jgi:hypothetical protein
MLCGSHTQIQIQRYILDVAILETCIAQVMCPKIVVRNLRQEL